MKEKPLGTAGLVLVMVLLLTDIFADFPAPYPMSKVDLTIILAPLYAVTAILAAIDYRCRTGKGQRISLLGGHNECVLKE